MWRLRSSWASAEREGEGRRERVREKNERWEEGERREWIKKEKWENEREKKGREWEKEEVVQDY